MTLPNNDEFDADESALGALNTPEPTLRWVDADADVRPAYLDDIVGQDSIRDQLRVAMRAAKGRGQALDHILLTGPAGLGKTTIASVISTEMGQRLKMSHGPAVSATEVTNVVAELLGCTPADRMIWFVDEIHAISKDAETLMLPLVEQFKFIDVDRLTPFTLIGATTDPAKLSRPFFDRFGMHFTLDFYPDADIEKIVKRTYCLLTGITREDLAVECATRIAWRQPAPNQPRKKMQVQPPIQVALSSLAHRSRGVPRVANNLVRRTLDYMYDGEDRPNKPLTPELLAIAMRAMGIDQNGLRPIDRRVLEAMFFRYGAKPVGVASLASAIGESAATLESTVEPNLVRRGYINRTGRGRMITPQGVDVAVAQHAGTTEY